MDKITFLKEALKSDGYLTNFHENYRFLQWSDLFYEGASIEKCKRTFTYYASKLVEMGHCTKPYKMGIGEGGMSEYGVRTQTRWDACRQF